MKAPHLQRGELAEKFALRWLRRQGLQLICRNFHCRYGELDLVMEDKGCVAIIEVRYRNTDRYGGSIGSVNPAKQKRICLAAACLLQQNPKLNQFGIRFDVVALSGSVKQPSIDWRQRAFDIST